MINRYTLPEIGKVWSEENRLRVMLEVEVLACEGMAAIGQIPAEAAKVIREKADFDIDRIKEIERETKHDVIAFLTNVSEYVGKESQYIHMGMTSSDILDTALSVQMKQAGEIILEKLYKLKEVIKRKAQENKYTLMMGRTHGVHAEPVTFGLKMAVWYTETERSIVRMKQAIETISVGAISGAVGTFANIDPRIEEYVCEKLDLKPAQVSTQIIQRDRHAEYMLTLAVIASSLDKFATEIRGLQKSETFEVMEEFTKGQKGSSAMPHKRNPMQSERVAGLARVIRGNTIPAMENVALWHERDLTQSSVERIILPDSTILLDYILDLFIKVTDGLVVNKEKMMENLEANLGLVFSQRVMLSIVEKGVPRDTVYKWVQEGAMKAWDEKIQFKEIVMGNPEIREYLNENEIEEIFDFSYHTKHVDTIFKRCGLE
ncbi:MAG: adenylosuccinate lyase [Eubacteriales bacterium]|jgi:adenylosuccinate lyase|nr:adenylosuccinate lyase [Eubacteriales bacterium]NCC80929.1 adenylosuccinate lyase [Clostridia bacterium]